MEGRLDFLLEEKQTRKQRVSQVNADPLVLMTRNANTHTHTVKGKKNVCVLFICMIQGRGLRALFFLKSIKVYILAEVDVTHTHTQTPIITPELSIRPRTHTKHAHLPVLVTPCCLLGKRSSSVSSIEELRHRIGRGELIKILNDNQKASLWENFDLTVRSECVSQHYL